MLMKWAVLLYLIGTFGDSLVTFRTKRTAWNALGITCTAYAVLWLYFSSGLFQ